MAEALFKHPGSGQTKIPWSFMGISRRAVLSVVLCSVVAEMLMWALLGMTARTNSYGRVYKISAAFHEPAEAVRFYLFRTVENHASAVGEIAMMLILFCVALIEWLFIFFLAACVWRLTVTAWRRPKLFRTI